MILLGKPKEKDIHNFIHFDFDKSNELHLQGIIPIYRDNTGMWFYKKDIDKTGGENIE